MRIARAYSSPDPNWQPPNEFHIIPRNRKKCGKSWNVLNGLKATKRGSENMFSKKRAVLGGQLGGSLKECKRGPGTRAGNLDERAPV